MSIKNGNINKTWTVYFSGKYEFVIGAVTERQVFSWQNSPSLHVTPLQSPLRVSTPVRVSNPSGNERANVRRSHGRTDTANRRTTTSPARLYPPRTFILVLDYDFLMGQPEEDFYHASVQILKYNKIRLYNGSDVGTAEGLFHIGYYIHPLEILHSLRMD